MSRTSAAEIVSWDVYSCQNRKQVGVWGEGMEKLWDKRVVVYQLSLGRGTAEDGNGKCGSSGMKRGGTAVPPVPLVY